MNYTPKQLVDPGSTKNVAGLFVDSNSAVCLKKTAGTNGRAT